MPTFNFEDGLFPSSWKNADGEPWQTTTEESDGGTFSLASNNTLSDRQISSCYIIGDFDAGDFDLRYFCSSEGNFDFGYVVVDGVAILNHISGSVPWTTMTTHALSAGVHIIQFVYIKENSTGGGNDAFYVDNVSLPNFTAIDSDVDYIDPINTVFTQTSGTPLLQAPTTGDRNTPFSGAIVDTSGAAHTDIISYTSPSDSPAGKMFYVGFSDIGGGTIKLFIDNAEVASDQGTFFAGNIGNLRAPIGHYQSVSSGAHTYRIEMEESTLTTRAYIFYEPSFTSSGGGISGAITQTTNGFTQSAIGTVTASGFTGTITQTAQSFTQSLVGTNILNINGGITQSLNSFTQSANGTITAAGFTGTINQNISSFTQLANGIVTTNLTGVITQTAGAFTQLATGVIIEDINGVITQTISSFTQSATGIVPLNIPVSGGLLGSGSTGNGIAVNARLGAGITGNGRL